MFCNRLYLVMYGFKWSKLHNETQTEEEMKSWSNFLRFFSFSSQWAKSVDSREKPVQTLSQAYA